MAYELIKWVLKKQTGLNEPEKREEANPWAIYRKARMATTSSK